MATRMNDTQSLFGTGSRLNLVILGLKVEAENLAEVLLIVYHKDARHLRQEALDNFASKRHTGVIQYFQQHYIKEGVFDTIIMSNVAAAVAPNYGLPVIKYQPQAASAKNYKLLAKEVMKQNE